MGNYSSNKTNKLAELSQQFPLHKLKGHITEYIYVFKNTFWMDDLRQDKLSSKLWPRVTTTSIRKGRPVIGVIILSMIEMEPPSWN